MKGHHDRDGKFVVDHHQLVRVSSETFLPGSREATLVNELFSAKLSSKSGRKSAHSPIRTGIRHNFPPIVDYKLRDWILPENEYERPKVSRTPKSVVSKFPKYQAKNTKLMEAQKLFVTNALSTLGEERRAFVVMRKDIEHMISYNGSLQCASVVEDNCKNANNFELIKWDKMYVGVAKKERSRPQSTSTVQLAASQSTAPSLSAKGTAPQTRKLPRVASTTTDAVVGVIQSSGTLKTVSSTPEVRAPAVQLEDDDDCGDEEDVEYL